MTDKELLDWLADNDIIEGFGGVDEDVYEIACRLAIERDFSGEGEPTIDDKRKALRLLIMRATTARPAPAGTSEKE